MKAPARPENGPLYEYTLMPCHMRDPFYPSELRRIELAEGFPHMKGSRVMKIPAGGAAQAYQYGDLLFDLEKDPEQKQAIQDEGVTERLTQRMREMMRENEAPREQYERLGIL